MYVYLRHRCQDQPQRTAIIEEERLKHLRERIRKKQQRTNTHKLTHKYNLHSYCSLACRRKPNEIHKIKLKQKYRICSNKHTHIKYTTKISKDKLKQKRKEKGKRGKIDHVAKMGR